MKRGRGASEVRLRLGPVVSKWLREGYVPEWIKEKLRERIGEGDVIDALRVWYTCAKVFQQVLKAYASTVKKAAAERGMTVIVSGRSCHIKRCGTCMGKYPTHYPRFTIYTPEGRREVRTQDRRDFLRQFFTDEKITDFEAIIGHYNRAWQMHNYLQACFEKVGTLQKYDEVG